MFKVATSIQGNAYGCYLNTSPYGSEHEVQKTDYVMCACGITHYGPNVKFRSPNGNGRLVPARKLLDAMRRFDNALVANADTVRYIICCKKTLVLGCRCREAFKVSH